MGCLAACRLWASPVVSPPDTASAFERDVRARIDAGRYAEAESLAVSRLEALESAGDTMSLSAVETLDLLVEALRLGGRARLPLARASALRAVRIRESTAASDSLGWTQSLLGLAALLRGTGDAAEAIPLYERGLATRERLLGAEHERVADALLGLAACLYDQGRYADARRAAERALAIRERRLGPDDLGVAEALNNLAGFRYRLGEVAEVGPLYERSLAIRERRLPPDHTELAVGYAGMATYYYAIGEFASALRMYARALEIRERTLGADHLLVAQTLASLCLCAKRMGEFERAHAYCARALEIQERTLGRDHPDLAGTLQNLAEVERSRGDLGSARLIYERAIALRERALGADHPMLAVPIHNLALLLRQMGLARAALPYFERAVAMTERRLGAAHPDYAHILGNCGLARAQCGDGAGALAAAVASERVLREHLRLVARGLSEREALQFESLISSAQELAFSLAAAGQLDPAALQRAWDLLVRSRTLVLDEMVERRRAAREASDPEVARLDTVLAAAARRVSALIVQGPRGDPASHASAVSTARTAYELAERERARHGRFEIRRRERYDVGFADVARFLPRGTALLAYARYDRYPVTPAEVEAWTPEPGPPGAGKAARKLTSYLALVLRGRETDPVCVPLGAASRIDSLIGDWHGEAARGALVRGRTAAAAEAAYRAAGERLRQAIWDPVERHLRGAERVYVVPDGGVNLVNLGALPIDRQSYLVESGIILHPLTSERDLVPSRDPEPGRGLLALGGANYDSVAAGEEEVARFSPASPAQAASAMTLRSARAGCEEFRSLRFRPLPGAAREAEEVAAEWRSAIGSTDGDGEAVCLTGSRASEAALKRLAPGHRMLHLATHGFFVGEACAENRGGLRGVGGMGRADPAGTPDTLGSGLLMCGLALAGANRRDSAGAVEEDGILTAAEVASLDLSGTRCVVLSGCETGLGTVVAGEGVLGLRRAFQTAGAGTVVMTLWSVEDQAARRWMGVFYRRLVRDGLDVAMAVRAAHRELLEARRAAGESTHPLYWSAFVSTGS